MSSQPQLELLKKISDTLGVLGLGGLRAKVQEEIAQLGAIVANKEPANEDVAGADGGNADQRRGSRSTISSSG